MRYLVLLFWVHALPVLYMSIHQEWLQERNTPVPKQPHTTPQVAHRQ